MTIERCFAGDDGKSLTALRETLEEAEAAGLSERTPREVWEAVKRR